MKIVRLMLLFLGACLLTAVPGWAQEDFPGEWPREIDIPNGVVVIYQPQPEKLEGNILYGRTAVAIERDGPTEPVFGVIWFEATLDTDRSERTATITELSVTSVRFPDQDEEKEQKLRVLLEREIPKWDLPISMDHLLTSLELEEKRAQDERGIKTDPPKIKFVAEPAILIQLDGEPRLVPEEGTDLMRVVNTPYTLLFLATQKKYYLYADGDTWYTAPDIRGEWTVTDKVPQNVAARTPKPDPEDEEQKESQGETGPPPKVIVATEPTELISCKGNPEFTPIAGTDLLYVSNTDSDLALHVTSQKYYVLLAGRWYAGSGLEGPWEYVPGEELPEDFSAIPEDSAMGTVLYAVPGTDVADEAVLDAQIPQTAAVKREDAKLEVDYDGEPKMEPIKGTEMTYAVNTSTPVIYYNKSYYACDEAVWFVSGTPRGPWLAASSVPVVIYTIPPQCPVYNVTYVRIYKATPDVIYVGYTPGYTGTYVYHSTIVYGTGYRYPYWYGRYYYPRPATWGFHVRWNPWSGWGFGFSYGYGPYRFTICAGGWYRGGWWGPVPYRSYGRGYRHGYRYGHHSGYRAGYRAGRRDARRDNIYRSKRNMARTLPASGHARVRSDARRVSKRPNNVYADRKGNIHRKTDRGWQTRTRDGWKSDKRSQAPGDRSRAQQARKQQPRTREQVRKQQPRTREQVRKQQPRTREQVRKQQPQTGRQVRKQQPRTNRQVRKQQPQTSRQVRKQQPQTGRQVRKQQPQTREARQVRSGTGRQSDRQQLERSSRSRQRGDQISRSYNNARRDSQVQSGAGRGSSAGGRGRKSGGGGRRR